MQRRIILLGWLGATAAAPLQVQAQATSAPDAAAATPERAGEALPENATARERAKSLFEAGIAHYRDARYQEALRSFQAAHDSFDSPAFIFNIARTCDQLRDVPCALRNYRGYRRRAPDASDSAAVNQRILALEAELAARGVQQLTVQTTPPGAMLHIDGRASGKTPWAGELSPGVHTVRLTMPGFAELNVNVEVPPTHASDQSFLMSEAVGVAPAAPPVAEASALAAAAATSSASPAATLGGHETGAAVGRTVRTWTYVALGASVAAFGGALAFELLSRESEQDVRQLPVQRDRVAAYQAMNDRQTTARILTGAGLGLTALGATLLVLDLRAPAQRPGAITARLETRGTGLALRGSW